MKSVKLAFDVRYDEDQNDSGIDMNGNTKWTNIDDCFVGLREEAGMGDDDDNEDDYFDEEEDEVWLQVGFHHLNASTGKVTVYYERVTRDVDDCPLGRDVMDEEEVMEFLESQCPWPVACRKRARSEQRWSLDPFHGVRARGLKSCGFGLSCLENNDVWRAHRVTNLMSQQ